MKILKRIAFVIVALIAIVLLSAAIVKKDYAVEREIIVNQPKTVVFNYIKLLKNQENYSVWQKMDPDMEKQFTGTDGTVGFVSSWNSEHKNVGKGEQEILKVEEGKRIDFEIRFIEPWETTDNAYMITESKSIDSTVVKWGFNGKMKYPMNIMLIFMNMEEILGKDLQQGLDTLKEILEKKS